jgi:hypothetical protein
LVALLAVVVLGLGVLAWQYRGENFPAQGIDLVGTEQSSNDGQPVIKRTDLELLCKVKMSIPIQCHAIICYSFQPGKLSGADKVDAALGRRIEAEAEEVADHFRDFAHCWSRPAHTRMPESLDFDLIPDLASNSLYFKFTTDFQRKELEGCRDYEKALTKRALQEVCLVQKITSALSLQYLPLTPYVSLSKTADKFAEQNITIHDLFFERNSVFLPLKQGLKALYEFSRKGVFRVQPVQSGNLAQALPEFEPFDQLDRLLDDALSKPKLSGQGRWINIVVEHIEGSRGPRNRYIGIIVYSKNGKETHKWHVEVRLFKEGQDSARLDGDGGIGGVLSSLSAEDQVAMAPAPREKIAGQSSTVACVGLVGLALPVLGLAQGEVLAFTYPWYVVLGVIALPLLALAVTVVAIFWFSHFPQSRKVSERAKFGLLRMAAGIVVLEVTAWLRSILERMEEYSKRSHLPCILFAAILGLAVYAWINGYGDPSSLVGLPMAASLVGGISSRPQEHDPTALRARDWKTVLDQYAHPAKGDEFMLRIFIKRFLEDTHTPYLQDDSTVKKGTGSVNAWILEFERFLIKEEAELRKQLQAEGMDAELYRRLEINAVAMELIRESKEKFIRLGWHLRHVHSKSGKYDDGELTPEELVDAAIRAGATVLYIPSRYDGLKGYMKARRHLRKNHPDIILEMRPAVEISAPSETGGNSLQYKVIAGDDKPDLAKLQQVIQEMLEKGKDVFLKIYHVMQELGQRPAAIADIVSANHSRLSVMIYDELLHLPREKERIRVNIWKAGLMEQYQHIFAKFAQADIEPTRTICQFEDVFGSWLYNQGELSPNEVRMMRAFLRVWGDVYMGEELAGKQIMRIEEFAQRIKQLGFILIKSHPARDIIRGYCTIDQLAELLAQLAQEDLIQGIEATDNMEQTGDYDRAIQHLVCEKAGVKLRIEGGCNDFHRGGDKDLVNVTYDPKNYFDDGRLLAQPYIGRAEKMLTSKRFLEALDLIVFILNDIDQFNQRAMWLRREILKALRNDRPTNSGATACLAVPAMLFMPELAWVKPAVITMAVVAVVAAIGFWLFKLRPQREHEAQQPDRRNSPRTIGLPEDEGMPIGRIRQIVRDSNHVDISAQCKVDRLFRDIMEVLDDIEQGMAYINEDLFGRRRYEYFVNIRKYFSLLEEKQERFELLVAVETWIGLLGEPNFYAAMTGGAGEDTIITVDSAEVAAKQVALKAFRAFLYVQYFLTKVPARVCAADVEIEKVEPLKRAIAALDDDMKLSLYEHTQVMMHGNDDKILQLESSVLDQFLAKVSEYLHSTCSAVRDFTESSEPLSDGLKQFLRSLEDNVHKLRTLFFKRDYQGVVKYINHTIENCGESELHTFCLTGIRTMCGMWSASQDNDPYDLIDILEKNGLNQELVPLIANRMMSSLLDKPGSQEVDLEKLLLFARRCDGGIAIGATLALLERYCDRFSPMTVNVQAAFPVNFKWTIFFEQPVLSQELLAAIEGLQVFASLQNPYKPVFQILSTKLKANPCATSQIRRSGGSSDFGAGTNCLVLPAMLFMPELAWVKPAVIAIVIVAIIVITDLFIKRLIRNRIKWQGAAELIKMAKEGPENLRGEAICTLTKLAPTEEITRALIGIVQNRNEQSSTLRENTVFSLSLLEPLPREAVECVLGILRSDETELHATAFRSLDNMDLSGFPEFELEATALQANRLIKQFFAEQSQKTAFAVRQFAKQTIARAMLMEDNQQAESLQIIAGQLLNIIFWIQQGVPGAGAIELTADENDMLWHPDRKKYPLGSFIKAKSIALGTTDEEFTPRFFWRGFELAKKLGEVNIIKEFIYDQAAFEAGIGNMVMYIMDHGFLSVPDQLWSHTGNTEGKLSTIHETSFLHQRIPGSIQAVSTGIGHAQGTSLDIKQATEGEGVDVQLNILCNRHGKPVEVLAQAVKAGEWTMARPGHVDSVLNGGVNRFNDFSCKLSKEDARRFVRKQYYRRTRADVFSNKPGLVSPYIMVYFDGKPYLVKMQPNAPPVTWLSAPDANIFQNKSLLELYPTLTKNGQTHSAKIDDIVEDLITSQKELETAPIPVISLDQALLMTMIMDSKATAKVAAEQRETISAAVWAQLNQAVDVMYGECRLSEAELEQVRSRTFSYWEEIYSRGQGQREPLECARATIGYLKDEIQFQRHLGQRDYYGALASTGRARTLRQAVARLADFVYALIIYGLYYLGVPERIIWKILPIQRRGLILVSGGDCAGLNPLGGYLARLLWRQGRMLAGVMNGLDGLVKKDPTQDIILITRKMQKARIRLNQKKLKRRRRRNRYCSRKYSKT